MNASSFGRCVAALCFGSSLALSTSAQTAPAPAPAPTAPAGSAENTPPPVELSPFEVRAENDVGYQAANTTSGSRLNSRLKDTPAAVSAFTPEFLADIAATNLEEMLAHATNIEVDVEDANAGFNNPQGRGADGNDYQFRMRGSPAGASRDFVESSVPVDLYNVERAEVASGPNSILFGLGQAGGLVSLSGKKANLNRNRTTVKSMFGSWSFERYEADHNQVIIPKKVSLRLLGLYQNNEGWRYWDFNDQARWTVAAAYQPFKNTTINASFEKGHMDNNLTIGWNGQDQISGWEDAGRPVFDGTVAQPGTNRFNANNNRLRSTSRPASSRTTGASSRPRIATASKRFSRRRFRPTTSTSPARAACVTRLSVRARSRCSSGCRRTWCSSSRTSAIGPTSRPTAWPPPVRISAPTRT
jgi:outer membrane receptor protein involved in Fe transport